MTYTNSPLVSYTKITANKTSPRNHVIDTITIHCIVGQWTAKQGCDYFATTDRQCSANYVVGKDGSIGLSVEEKDRSWCSSSSANDNRAITIEVASDTTDPYAVTDAAYNALIKLVADICQRNGIKKLVWSTSKTDRVNHANGCNMTVHRDFANKSCPGAYLYNKHGEIAAAVNALIGATGTASDSASSGTSLTAGTALKLEKVDMYASSTAKTKASTKTGTYYLWSTAVVNGRVRITNETSNVGVSGQVTGWISLEDAENAASTSSTGSAATTKFTPYLVKVTASVLNIRKGAGTSYAIVGAIKDKGTYTIVAESNGWGKLKSGAGWISLKYTKKV